MSEHDQIPVTVASYGAGSGSGAGGEDELMSRRRQQLAALLRGRWVWVVVLALVLGIAGAVGGFFSQGDRYQATAQIRVNPTLPSLGLFPHDSDSRIPPMFRDFVENQVKLIQSPEVMGLAMGNPKLRAAAPEGFDSEDLSNLIAVNNTSRGYIFNVSAESSDRKLARVAVDAVVSSYLHLFRTQQGRETSHQQTLLNKRKLDLSHQLQNLKDRRRAIAGALGADGLAQRQKNNLERVDQYQQMVDRLKISARDQPGQGEGDKPDYTHMSVAELANRFPQMATLFDQKKQIQQQVETLKAQGYGEQYHAVRKLVSQRGVIQKRIDQLADDIHGGMVSPAVAGVSGSGRTLSPQQLSARLEQAKANLAQAQAQSVDLGAKLQRVQKLNAQIKHKQQSLNDTLTALDKHTVEQADSGQISGRVEQVGGMQVPKHPSNFKARVRLAVMGGFLGVCCGVALVLGIGLLDRRMRHAVDAEAGLSSARMLGVLPTLPRNLADPEQAEQAAHGVHHIRTLLQLTSHDDFANPAGRRGRGVRQAQAADGTGAWVYAVTSPAAGSGKSSLVTALGLSFAAAGSRTLLIDCDVVGAGLTARLGAGVHPPLTDLLQRQGLINDAQAREALRRADETGRPLEDVVVDDLALVAREDMDRILAQRDENMVGLLDACKAQHSHSGASPRAIAGAAQAGPFSSLAPGSGSGSRSSSRSSPGSASARSDTSISIDSPGGSDGPDDLYILETDDDQPSLIDLLQDAGLLKAAQAREAMDRAAATHRPLDQVLVDDLALVSHDDMARVLDRRDQHTVGLIDACEAQTLDGFVSPTEMNNLSILPVGRAQPRDAGSLSPTAFHQLIEEARRSYDVVMIDTGPMLGSLEASIAVTEADKTIMVISRGDEKTPAHRSLEMIQHLGGDLAGVVFNHATQVDVDRSSYGSTFSGSHSRRFGRHDPNPQHAPERIDRFGPLGSAVASYGSVPRTMEQAPVTSNGNGHGNGHAT